MQNPFRYFNSSPEIIRLAVMMYVRFPLSLRQLEDLLSERGRLRWPRKIGQSAKVYSGCFSSRQNPLELIFLLLLLRLWGCGQGAERLVHHIHRRLAAVCLGRGPPGQRCVRPLEVVKADPITDQAPGLEAVGDFVQVDRLVFERAPQPFDEDVVHAPAPCHPSRSGCRLPAGVR